MSTVDINPLVNKVLVILLDKKISKDQKKEDIVSCIQEHIDQRVQQYIETHAPATSTHVRKTNPITIFKRIRRGKTRFESKEAKKEFDENSERIWENMSKDQQQVYVNIAQERTEARSAKNHVEKKTKKINGLLLFGQKMKDEIINMKAKYNDPRSIVIIKSEMWNALDDSERRDYNLEAQKLNGQNGIQKSPKNAVTENETTESLFSDDD